MFCNRRTDTYISMCYIVGGGGGFVRYCDHDTYDTNRHTYNVHRTYAFSRIKYSYITHLQQIS